MPQRWNHPSTSMQQHILCEDINENIETCLSLHATKTQEADKRAMNYETTSGFEGMDIWRLDEDKLNYALWSLGPKETEQINERMHITSKQWMEHESVRQIGSLTRYLCTLNEEYWTSAQELFQDMAKMIELKCINRTIPRSRHMMNVPMHMRALWLKVGNKCGHFGCR